MNNIEIWVKLTERHETWLNPEEVVKLRARGIKALIDQAYQCGLENGSAKSQDSYERGFNAGLKAGQASVPRDTGYEDVLRSFEGLFGKKKF